MRDVITISVATGCVINIRVAMRPSVINVRVVVMRDVINISVATGCVINIRVAVRPSVINVRVAVMRDVISISVANRMLVRVLNRPARGAWAGQFPCSLGNASCILHAVTPQHQTKL